MENVASKGFEALGPFPVIQAVFGILFILAFAYIGFRATKDKSRPPELIPQWLMMGPMHDMMQAVYEVAEEARRTNDLLERIDQSLLACKATLEMIRNESRMR